MSKTQDEKSVYAELLKEKGPGVNLIMFAGENHKKDKQRLLDNQVSLLAKGKLKKLNECCLIALLGWGWVIKIAKGDPLVPDKS